MRKWFISIIVSILMMLLYLDGINFRSINNNNICWTNDLRNISLLKINIEVWSSIVTTLFAILGTYIVTSKTDNKKLEAEKRINKEHNQKVKKLTKQKYEIKKRYDDFENEVEKLYSLTIMDYVQYTDAYPFQGVDMLQVVNIPSLECHTNEPIRVRSQVKKLYKIMDVEKRNIEVIIAQNSIENCEFIVPQTIDNLIIFTINMNYYDYISEELIKQKVSAQGHNEILNSFFDISEYYRSGIELERVKPFLKEKIKKMKETFDRNLNEEEINISGPDFTYLINLIDRKDMLIAVNLIERNPHHLMSTYIFNKHEINELTDEIAKFENSLQTQLIEVSAELESVIG